MEQRIFHNCQKLPIGALAFSKSYSLKKISLQMLAFGLTLMLKLNVTVIHWPVATSILRVKFAKKHVKFLTTLVSRAIRAYYILTQKTRRSVASFFRFVTIQRDI